MEQVSWQVILNFLAVYLIRFAEGSHWSFLEKIDEDYVWLRRGIITVFSAATAAGLVFHFEVKTGDFVLQGNFWSLVHAFKHVAQNYLGIQGMYWVKTVYDEIVQFRPVLRSLTKAESLSQAETEAHLDPIQPPKS